MKIAAFTSCNYAYMPNARIVANSAKEHQANWDFYLLFNDRQHFSYDWDLEPFDFVTHIEDLDLQGRSFYKWVFQYNVIELCTATKGIMSIYLLRELGYDAVVYLDPDTRLFSPLVEVEELIKNGVGCILTPHLTDAEEDQYSIWSHEMAALKHGTFNLGFFVFTNTKNGNQALDWWAQRLLDYSHIDFERGLFTDQKWANIMPYIFDDIVVLRDRAYNVATWNMKNRKIEYNSQSSSWKVNGNPLRFYHFSGFGKDFAWANHELKHLSPNPDLIKLWDLYKELYANNQTSGEHQWFWGYSGNGIQIIDEKRSQYSSSIIYPYE